jgi:hypothetical protein
LLSQGRDFGPALKAFDNASNYEKRMECMPKVLRAKTEYETEITAALKKTESKIGRKAQEALLKQIDKIWKDVEAAAQPPRPSGQMVSSYTLRSFDLAAGIMRWPRDFGQGDKLFPLERETGRYGQSDTEAVRG